MSELIYRAVYAVIFLGQASGKILIILIECGPHYREFRQCTKSQETANTFIHSEFPGSKEAIKRFWMAKNFAWNSSLEILECKIPSY